MPADLTALFGEGWCVTLAPLDVSDVLEEMGVEAPVRLPDGLARVTERLRGGTRADVLLLGRRLTGRWSMVLELEGTTGWVGLGPALLEALSANGGTACSAHADPNRVDVSFAQDGERFGRLDVVTGLRVGEFGASLASALTAVGFPGYDDRAGSGDDAVTGEAAGLGAPRRALLALRAATGVSLTSAAFADPWIGGPTTSWG